ncbi:amidase [Streptomyces sp. NPDC002523]
MDRAARDELCRMPVTELAHRIRTSQVSPLEAVDAVLDRVADVDPALNAYCTLVPDRARARARALGERLAHGEDPGVLAGVPLGVKDLISTRGIRTTSASPAYEDFVPDEDDIVVERAVAAGAVVVGKTNTSEFGYSATGHNPLFPTTRNPWNTTLTPGGSSAGSAAAVAAGLAPVALGSDGGGSVRVPAAHCGLVGFKAAMGRVPVWPGCRDERQPGVSGWESLEHIGPLTRTVADAALMLSVLAGPDARDRHSIPCGDVDWRSATREPDITGLRVAYSADLGYLAVDPQVREVVGAAVAVLEKELGCHVEQVTPGWSDPAERFTALIVAETDLTGMRRLIDTHGGRMSPHLVTLMRQSWTAEQFTDANIARKAIVNKMARLMSNYDLFVTPTTAVPPFAVDIQGPERIDGRMVSHTAWTGFTLAANLTGQPSVSVPAGWTSDGLPVGLQITGRHLADAEVLRAAASFERAAPWAHRWPADPPQPPQPPTTAPSGL